MRIPCGALRALVVADAKIVAAACMAMVAGMGWGVMVLMEAIAEVMVKVMMGAMAAVIEVVAVERMAAEVMVAAPKAGVVQAEAAWAGAVPVVVAMVVVVMAVAYVHAHVHMHKQHTSMPTQACTHTHICTPACL